MRGCLKRYALHRLADGPHDRVSKHAVKLLSNTDTLLCVAGCPTFVQFTFYSGKDIPGFELRRSTGAVTGGVPSLVDLTRAFEVCYSDPLCE